MKGDMESSKGSVATEEREWGRVQCRCSVSHQSVNIKIPLSIFNHAVITWYEVMLYVTCGSAFQLRGSMGTHLFYKRVLAEEPECDPTNCQGSIPGKVLGNTSLHRSSLKADRAWKWPSASCEIFSISCTLSPQAYGHKLDVYFATGGWTHKG
jgi:hypothetical protein